MRECGDAPQSAAMRAGFVLLTIVFACVCLCFRPPGGTARQPGPWSPGLSVLKATIAQPARLTRRSRSVASSSSHRNVLWRCVYPRVPRVQCPRGYFCSEGAPEPVPCDAGQYQPASGRASCIEWCDNRSATVVAVPLRPVTTRCCLSPQQPGVVLLPHGHV